MKTSIASKEARETRCLLRLLSEGGFNKKDYSKLLVEIKELIKIFTAITKTSQKNLNANS